MKKFTVTLCSVCLVPVITDDESDRKILRTIELDFGVTVSFCPECSAEHKIEELIRRVVLGTQPNHVTLSVTVLVDGEPHTAGEGPLTHAALLFNEKPRIRLR